MLKSGYDDKEKISKSSKWLSKISDNSSIPTTSEDREL